MTHVSDLRGHIQLLVRTILGKPYTIVTAHASLFKQQHLKAEQINHPQQN